MVTDINNLIDINKSDFFSYFNLLTEYSQKFNITSIIEKKDVYIKHFFDSLGGFDFFENNKKIVEIGSGGGFPSVPLKIANKSLKFTLIEATQKKCNFLNIVKDTLKFDNFDIINGRCEELSKTNLRETFDYAVARAVAPFNSLLEYLLPFIKVGGYAISYKGSNFKDELNISNNAINVLGGKLEKVYEYSLPEDYGSRSIIVVKKIKETPKNYPRKEAQIRKSPL